MRTLVSFEASGFPDESQWTSNGSPLVPDGRTIAGTIAAALSRAGFHVSDPEQHQFYGWCFDIACSDEIVWCLLQYPGPWLLLVKEKRSILRRLFGTRSARDLKAILTALDEAIKQEARFGSVEWFSEDEYAEGDKSGAETPL